MELIAWLIELNTQSEIDWRITFTGCNDYKSLYIYFRYFFYRVLSYVCTLHIRITPLIHSLIEELSLTLVLQSRHGFSFLKAADQLISVYRVKSGHCWTPSHSNVYKHPENDSQFSLIFTYYTISNFKALHFVVKGTLLHIQQRHTKASQLLLNYWV